MISNESLRQAFHNPYRKELFPTTVFHGGVENNQHLKELVIPYIEKTKFNRDNKIPEEWLTNNLITSFNNEDVNGVLLEDNDISRELQRQYGEALDRFFDEPYELKLQGIWYNVYTNGEWQESHTHLGGIGSPIHFACIHFLSFDPDIHNSVTLLDPLVTARGNSMEMKSNEYDVQFRPPVKEGDILMFPSYLPHEVSPGASTPEYPRITISFNLEVVKYGTEEENPES